MMAETAAAHSQGCGQHTVISLVHVVSKQHKQILLCVKPQSWTRLINIHVSITTEWRAGMIPTNESDGRSVLRNGGKHQFHVDSQSRNCSTSSSKTASFSALLSYVQMVSPKPYGVNSRVRGPEKERGDGVLSSEVLLSKAVLPPSTTSRPRRASEPGDEATPSRPAWNEDIVVKLTSRAHV